MEFTTNFCRNIPPLFGVGTGGMLLGEFGRVGTRCLQAETGGKAF